MISSSTAGFGFGVRAAVIPSYDPTVGNPGILATFEWGFWRAFCGLFYGHFGDRWGRKPMLVAPCLLVGAAHS